MSTAISDHAWDRRINELKEFERIHGHFHVPKGGKQRSLYNWIVNFRLDYKKFLNGKKTNGRINADRIAQLQAIGFDLPTLENTWDIRIEELKEFKRVHHHFNVPYTEAKYATLYNFIVNVRSDYKRFINGKKTVRLSDVRIAALKDIGFELNIADNAWDGRMEELKEFKRIHHHLRVPSRLAKYASLYGWILDTRKDYKRFLKGEKCIRLNDDRIAQLKDIGLALPGGGENRTESQEEVGIESNNFDNSDTESGEPVAKTESSASKSFDDWIGKLVKFKKSNGHCRVPSNSEQYKLLYRWTRECHERYRNRTRGKGDAMSDEEVCLLRYVGFEFPRSGGRKLG